MTPEEQRIAISEACGWTRCACNDPNCGAWFSSSGVATLGNPDYLNDLNAMHEAEKSLFSHNMERYENKLSMIVGDRLRAEYKPFYVTHAAASQRAEAFLKTIGKWKD
jgi:hypothetical protein